MKSVLVIVLSIALGACSPNQKQAPSKPAAPAGSSEPKADAGKSDSPKPSAGPPQFTSARPEQIASLSIADGGKCSVDSVNANESDTGWSVHRGEVITMGGWVLDLPTKTTSDWAVLRLDAPDGNAHFYAPTTMRGERADLFKVFGEGPGMNKATFTLLVNTASLPEATYKLAVLHMSVQGAQACVVQKTLSIVQ